MTSRPGGGTAAKPNGLTFTQNMDTNSRMGKPSTAGNMPAKPVLGNMHKQPANLGVAKLQAAIVARNKSKVS